uniref:TIL domain-containing protein n=1 Tax=Anopheles atroparvus TaxID=41427 RepID=A0A182ITF7_ANOAO
MQGAACPTRSLCSIPSSCEEVAKMVRSNAAYLLLLVLVGVAIVSSEDTSTTEEPNVDEPEPIIVCTRPGEVYNECGPACGDRTCENQGRADIQCSKQCVQGCFCRNGYVRNKATGYCILPYRCTREA